MTSKGTRLFSGTNVFMSRNLVPPKLFDSLLDALKLHGADIFMCCDPSRNGPNDYHIISSPNHEKFEDLRSKGCNLLGPQCVLSCANEQRALPKQGFTCCLAMDGVKVLASGFDKDEKVKLQKLVAAMGGTLRSKASLDVNFVVAKNVLAAKYKWALTSLKKPILTIAWLHQCWSEHRVVPQESYKVLPFSGLTICVTRVPADERKLMEKVVMQNGGKYSPELTRVCTHLICDAAEGDKYKVAQKWGHIHIVSRKWFDQSVSRKACLNEDAYVVQDGSISLNSEIPRSSRNKNFQKNILETSQSGHSSVAADSRMESAPSAQIEDPELEATLSQHQSYNVLGCVGVKNDISVTTATDTNDAANATEINDVTTSDGHGCIAEDSQIEGCDLYLSDCRIFLIGFDAAEMRKLMGMVRDGGGSRFTSFDDKLTHVVVGNLSESARIQVRSFAALGVINIVRANWLEDCDRQRKEISVLQRHNALDLLFSKDSSMSNKGVTKSSTCSKEERTSTSNSSVTISSQVHETRDLHPGSLRMGVNEVNDIENPERSYKASVKPVHPNLILHAGKKPESGNMFRPSTVFEGQVFRFSNTFPYDRRAEILEWISLGGGTVTDDLLLKKVHFIVECHGVATVTTTAVAVSTHWIRSCLEDRCLFDVGSHVLYSPLPCQIPFIEFEHLRFCVSQYEEKERHLLRNLCFVLGAKFVERLTKKVTHLLCKFTSGPKYEAACKWGINCVTSDWIYECVRQNAIATTIRFRPREPTNEDREAGLCLETQYPTQFATIGSEGFDCKRLKLSEVPSHARQFPSRDEQTGSSGMVQHKKSNGYIPPPVPDVASAIEDLLEQTSKIQDMKSPEDEYGNQRLTIECSSVEDCSESCTSVVLSKPWITRTEKKFELHNHSGSLTAANHDGFSETQTDSQVVGYEEDLSGRQMIIDRVLARSSMA